MSSEYYLQKRTLSSWSHVTSYETLEEAQTNFNRAKVNSGYSWRIVKVEVVEEYVNGSEKSLKDEVAELDEDLQKPSEKPVQSIKSGWGIPSTRWGNKSTSDPDLKAEHGLAGKVWLGNPVTKEKKRVDPAAVQDMMAEGWIKAGPRTVL